MPQIRDESPADFEPVRDLLAAAFGGGSEVRLVDRLRASGRVALALVAEDAGRVLGHMLFSPISIETGGGKACNAMALAPLAVHPAFQRLGIGSALVSTGLARLRETACGRVLVLGDPAYYPRFGFQPAARFGVRCPFPAPEEAFMALELSPGAFAGCTGMAAYGPAFDDLE